MSFATQHFLNVTTWTRGGIDVSDPLIEQKLCIYMEQQYRKRISVLVICAQLHEYARSLGFDAVMSAHEVESANLFFRAGDVVKSALILIRLQPIRAPEGYHVRWTRMKDVHRPSVNEGV